MADSSQSTTDWIKVELSDNAQTANVTLAGVSIVQGSGPGDALVVTEGGLNLTLKEGTVNTLQGGIWNSGLQNNGNTLVIKGDGTLYAKGGRDGAGIGAAYTGSAASNITIEGGIIYATGGSGGGAGIGGGCGNSGDPHTNAENVAIKGGTVIATGGGNAAGIGGGDGLNGNIGAMDNLSIEGGSVLAVGGEDGAPGIGGSEGSIAISGGSIAAATSGSGPCIGFSEGGATSTVSITGGVFADDATAVADNKVYGVAPAKGYQTQANTDVATKDDYPLAVVKGQAVGTLALVDGADAHADYTGAALAAASVVKEAKYGEVDAEDSDIVFDYKKAAEADDTYAAGLPKDAGSYTVRAVLSGKTIGGETYQEATKTASFVIAPAPLTVTAKDQFIVYGDVPSGAGVDAEGFVNGEGTSTLGGALGYDFDYRQYDEVSGSDKTYTITPKGLTSDNYAITFKPGTLTVNPKEVGLTWSGADDRAYDGVASAVVASIPAAELVNGDAVSVLVEGGDEVNAGAYTAQASLSSAGGKASNYILAAASKEQAYRVLQAEAPQATGASMDVKAGAAHDYSYGLDALLPSLEGACSYGEVTFTVKDDADMLAAFYERGSASITQNTLMLPILEASQAGAGRVGRMEIEVASQNYKTFANTVTVNAVDREILEVSASCVPETYAYNGETLGDAIELSVEAKNADGEVVAGDLTWDDPNAVPGVGDYLAAWTFTPADGLTYQVAKGATLIKVTPKPVGLVWSNVEDRVFGDGKQVGAVVEDGGILAGDEVAVAVAGGDARDAGVHTAVATLEGAQAGNYALADGVGRVAYSIAQSGTAFEPGSVKMLDPQGQVIEGAAVFSYGEKVVVKARPSSTGEQPLAQTLSLSASSPAPAKSGQMALFYGDVQVSDAVDADGEGVYTLQYDTASGRVPVGTKVTLVAEYVASGNMVEARESVELTVNPKVVGLEWSNIAGRIAGDGKQVSAKAAGLLEGDDVTVTVEGGDAAEIGTYVARAVSLAGAQAANYALPGDASTSYAIAAREAAGGEGASSGGESGGKTAESAGAAKRLASTGDSATSVVLPAIGLAAASAAVLVLGRRNRRKQPGLK